MNTALRISIEENSHGVIYFEMTDGIYVARKTSIDECLKYFGIYASEDTIKEWARIAAMNNNTKG